MVVFRLRIASRIRDGGNADGVISSWQLPARVSYRLDSDDLLEFINLTFARCTTGNFEETKFNNKNDFDHE